MLPVPGAPAWEEPTRVSRLPRPCARPGAHSEPGRRGGRLHTSKRRPAGRNQRRPTHSKEARRRPTHSRGPEETHAQQRPGGDPRTAKRPGGDPRTAEARRRPTHSRYPRSLTNSASGPLCTLCFLPALGYVSAAHAEPCLGSGPDRAVSIQPSLFRGNFRLTVTPSLPSTRYRSGSNSALRP